MPELICDTSALIALHQVGVFHILPALATRVIVPGAVHQELARGRTVGHNVPDVASIDWIAIRTPTARPPLPDASELDAGESDVLWVALESPGAVVVLDEAAARRVAAKLGIALTGTLGLLVDAKRSGLIPNVAPLLDELNRHAFHMSPRIRQTILKAAGETS